MGQPLANAPPVYSYQRRTPEDCLLRQIVLEQWPGLEQEIREACGGRGLPEFIAKAVEKFRDCGLLARGFVRVLCRACGKEQLVAFSCKTRGICPSCDGKRMVEVAAHLVDSVIPAVPIRQFVLTVPPELRQLLAWSAEFRRWALGAFMRAIEKHYVGQARAEGLVKPRFAAISVMQRYDGALRVFPHWHVLAADGVWHETQAGLRFWPAPQLYTFQTEILLADIVKRVTRKAERCFAKRADEEGNLRPGDPALAALLQHSLFGPQELERITVPVPKPGPRLPGFRVKSKNCGDLDDFGLHAATRVAAVARERLEKLVRYICRPAIAIKRLEAVGPFRVRIHFKAPRRDGAKAVVLSRRDLLVRVLAQIQLPRRPSLVYHGLWAPAAKRRAEIVPALGGRVEHNRRKKTAAQKDQRSEPAEQTASGAKRDAKAEERTSKLRWADCLKRAFFFDILQCPCGGRREVIAAIIDTAVAEKILRHVGLWRSPQLDEVTEIRGPPEELGPVFDQQDEDREPPPPVEWAA